MGVITMTGTVPLLLLSALVTGVVSWRPKEVYIKAGEMVALWCPQYKGFDDTNLIWTNHTDQETDMSTMSSAEQRKMGVLLHERTLVILSANINHQGNYSCSYGNVSRRFWFRLTVYTQSREYDERAAYSKTCYTQESCMLNCPDVGLPAVNTPNMTRSGLSWHKKGESQQKVDHFDSVEMNDQGVYICTRSYTYNLHIYRMTFAVVLDVHPRIIPGKTVILSPHQNEVFHVALGSAAMVECKAVIYSDFDEVFWLSGTSFVERNDNLPVFYNSTRENTAEEMRMTASLVFKKVSEEDIKRKYTCKLESDDQPSSFVTITLAQTASPLSVPLVLSIGGMMAMIVLLTAVLCVKFKVDIARFLQGFLCCSHSVADGKSHDVSVMTYKSVTDAGLNEVDRERLENVKEE